MFRVTNGGKLTHELVVGDQAFQAKHEQMMQRMGGKPMGDDADGVTVAPGQTKTLAYTFHQAGTFLFACHVSGHYQAGMHGTITAA
ncbi:MAG TPA: multicopper oxidase domain-containing protein [Actinomycetes bacterium]